MSMALNGSSQYAGVAASPSASAFVLAGWFRCTPDTDGLALCIDDGSFFQRSAVGINPSDGWVGYHQFTESSQNRAATTNQWLWVMLRFMGGTMTVRTCADGESAWNTATSDTSLSTLTPDRFRIGANGDPGSYFPGTVACVKVWSGTLPNDTELLAERLSTSVTATTGLWAAYDFLSGELETDRSGNARTLTLTGTPTYTADAPDDLSYGAGAPLGFDEDYQIMIPVPSGW